MIRRTIVAAALGASLALMPRAGLQAQTDPVTGFEIWAGPAGWLAGPGEEPGTGPRFGLALVGELTPAWGTGLEAVYGRFDPPVGEGLVGEYGVALSVRRWLRPGLGSGPYVLARAGWHRRATSGPWRTGDQDALLVGPEIGTITTLTDRIGLVTAVEGAWLWYGDVRAGRDGLITGEGGHGVRWGLRIGLSVRAPVRGGAGGERGSVSRSLTDRTDPRNGSGPSAPRSSPS